MQASFMPNIHMHHTVIENAQHQQARRVFAVVSILSLEPGVLHVCCCCTSQRRLMHACLQPLSAEQDVGRATLHCT